MDDERTLNNANTINRQIKNYIDTYNSSERPSWLTEAEYIDKLEENQHKLNVYIRKLENNNYEPVTLMTGATLTKEGILIDLRTNLKRIIDIIYGEQDGGKRRRSSKRRRTKRRRTNKRRRSSKRRRTNKRR